ncbi:hypothetical protein ACUWC2_28695, partial [Klebsiella pneumoniae]|uniref:hypothetical protein n=1 Tax=Klebsiella pneumoniae TaxID=573 RepID=UPI004055976E
VVKSGSAYRFRAPASGDLVIITRGKHISVLIERMKMALDTIWNWCQKQGLGVNPEKTVIIPFTRRKKIMLTPLTMGGHMINYAKKFKYLGITLDNKLTWN